MKEVILAGASGLVGSELLNLLLADRNIASIIALVRKPLNLEHKKLEQVIVDFDQSETYEHILKGDTIYCCLGTTNKKTPNKSEYRKIDYEYPLELARVACRNGVGQYHLISALGANKHSSIFYSRLKGELEEELKKVNFKKICIYQPSLLTGNRKEGRFMESIASTLMQLINPLLLGKLSKYRSIAASQVAKAMHIKTFSTEEGVFTYPSNIIKHL